LAAACTGGSAKKPHQSPQVVPAGTGGTLRIGVVTLPFDPLAMGPALDPQNDYATTSWELFRCCLLRTLLSHPGVPTAQGGAVPQPDLSASLPKVSPDGLAWTFTIKTGVHYGPPLQSVEVTAGDFIRA